jgi:arylsulfatase A-like enzyme
VEEPWYSAIDREQIPARFGFDEGGASRPAMVTGIIENQGLQSWTEERWTELRATYYGMCARVDHQFGLLLDTLKESGRYDRTAVFMFSDHGDYTGDYGLVEKNQNTFQDCLTRVPFLLKPPAGVPLTPGTRDALVELVDFSATVYELTGIDPGYDSFGRSLLPLLADPDAEHRDAVFCEGGRRYGEPQAMELESQRRPRTGGQDGLYGPRVWLQTTDSGPYHGKAVMCRTGTHKYVARLYELDELYDLEKDPGEERNVIDDPAYSQVLLELKNRLLSWYMETADVVPQVTDSRQLPVRQGSKPI